MGNKHQTSLSRNGSKGQGRTGEEETKPGAQRAGGQFGPRRSAETQGVGSSSPALREGAEPRGGQRQDVAPGGPMRPKRPGPDPAGALPRGTREPPGAWSRVQGQICLSGYFTKNSVGWTEGTGQVAFNPPTKPPAP